MNEIVPEFAVTWATAGLSAAGLLFLIAIWRKPERSDWRWIGLMLLLTWPCWWIYGQIDSGLDVTTFRGMGAAYVSLILVGAIAGLFVRALRPDRAALEGSGVERLETVTEVCSQGAGVQQVEAGDEVDQAQTADPGR